jgi:4-hydroxy-tetrahydrodipicolinate synthase
VPTTIPSGVWPVMLTPFTGDDRLDLPVLDRYTDWLMDRGAAGLFPVALSGEMYELDEPERLAVATRVAARAAGRVPVAAAIADAGTSVETAAAVGRMAATGVDIVVLVASVVLSESDEEGRLRDVVAAVIEENPDVTLGIYECPLPHHRVLSDEAVAWLAATDRFAFFKETSHDLERMRRRVALAEGSGMRIFNAGIENLAESLTVGVAGLSGWVANVYPDGVGRVCELGDGSEVPSAEALELQAALVAVEQRMAPSYPNSAKALVELRAGIGFAPRSRWRSTEVDEDELAAIIADAHAALGTPVR